VRAQAGEAEKTGNTEEFANKIGLSRRMLFNYLDDLRDMGLEIEYCRKKKNILLFITKNRFNVI
jgi:predicted DNA-binding transcriptional regulator YafY